jgi:hypothetical protein
MNGGSSGARRKSSGANTPEFLAGAEQQRREDVIDSTFDFLQSHSYRGRLSLATGCLTPRAKPAGSVSDFPFCLSRTRVPQWALDDPSGIRAA